MAAAARVLFLVLVAMSPAPSARATELVVAWAPLSVSVDAYQVERRPEDAGGAWRPIARVGGGETRFTDRSVTAGVAYCYRVRGVRGERFSPPSPSLCNIAAERPAAEPVVPAELEPVAVAPAPAPRGEDREVKALRRPRPKYPPEAQLRGLSGWVKLNFTVTAQGATRDVRVVAANPPGVFDQAAIDAAKLFAYAPRLENGIAVDRPNVETEITFTWIERGGRLVTDGRNPAPR